MCAWSEAAGRKQELSNAVGCKYQQRLKASGGEIILLGQQVECLLAYACCWLALMDYLAIKAVAEVY